MCMVWYGVCPRRRGWCASPQTGAASAWRPPSTPASPSPPRRPPYMCATRRVPPSGARLCTPHWRPVTLSNLNPVCSPRQNVHPAKTVNEAPREQVLFQTQSSTPGASTPLAAGWSAAWGPLGCQDKRAVNYKDNLMCATCHVPRSILSQLRFCAGQDCVMLRAPRHQMFAGGSRGLSQCAAVHWASTRRTGPYPPPVSAPRARASPPHDNTTAPGNTCITIARGHSTPISHTS